MRNYFELMEELVTGRRAESWDVVPYVADERPDDAPACAGYDVVESEITNEELALFWRFT